VQEGKFGFLDEAGHLVITPKFEEARNFVEGLACVRQGERWGFIDRSGRFVVAPQFEWAYDFSDGLAKVGNGLSTFYVDTRGRLLTLVSVAGDRAEKDLLRMVVRQQARPPQHVNDERVQPGIPAMRIHMMSWSNK